MWRLLTHNLCMLFTLKMLKENKKAIGEIKSRSSSKTILVGGIH